MKRNSLFVRILMAFGIVSLGLTTSACNTVRGAGDDLNSAADAVDEEI